MINSYFNQSPLDLLLKDSNDVHYEELAKRAKKEFKRTSVRGKVQHIHCDGELKISKHPAHNYYQIFCWSLPVNDWRSIREVVKLRDAKIEAIAIMILESRSVDGLHKSIMGNIEHDDLKSAMLGLLDLIDSKFVELKKDIEDHVESKLDDKIGDLEISSKKSYDSYY